MAPVIDLSGEKRKKMNEIIVTPQTQSVYMKLNEMNNATQKACIIKYESITDAVLLNELTI